MKKIFLSLLVSALLALCCVFAGCGAAPDIAEFPVQRTLNPESGLRTFSTEDGLITLKYPHTWYAVSDMQSLARFASPLTDATPDYREYVVIGFELNNSGRTAAETADAAFGEMKARFPLHGKTGVRRPYQGGRHRLRGRLFLDTVFLCFGRAFLQHNLCRNPADRICLPAGI